MPLNTMGDAADGRIVEKKFNVGVTNMRVIL